jgi:BASS family bile acid:Na+ symporter
LKPIANALAFIGRYGTEGFVVALLLGIALPQFAERARPLLPVSIFCFMTITFIRADVRVIAGLIRQPRVLSLTCLWLVVLPPLIVYAATLLIGRQTMDPGLLLGMAILGSAPPIMSAPAIAILYGIEPSLIIASVLGITVLSPIVAPFLVDLLAGQAVPLDASALALRLALFVGGGFALAMLIRRWLGAAKVAALKAEMDGFGVIMYFVFAVAAMDGVAEAAWNTPGQVLGFTAIAMLISLTGLFAAMAALRVAPTDQRLVLGYATGQRNMGLLIAALGAGVPKTTFLFFALAQAPIYLMPWMLKAWARRIAERQRRQDASKR